MRISTPTVCLPLRRLAAVFILLIAITPVAGSRQQEQPEETKEPTTIAELEQAILKTLEETHTPAAGVALVSRDEILWVAGLGTADVASDKPAGPETMFRVGSISKTFVSLAVLQLEEQGRLSIEDRVQAVVPEIAFVNPWEETDPIRIVHLLEHTTGFDDIHLREYVYGAPGTTLREGLDYHPHSRTSRWKPGTHFSYCNAGPAVAAYAIEKVTGQRYEDFIHDNFFVPIGMPTASFFLTDEVAGRLATGYNSDGVTVLPYWHIAMRPSGALNVTPGEMARFVQFLINRGAIDGRPLLRPTSMERMETPRTTLAARRGLRAGYGLGNYTRVENGFVFHGHDGGIAAYVASYGYLPEEGLGYVLMINSGNGAALNRLGKLLRGYLTKDLTAEKVPAAPVPPEELAGLAGYYEPISPRVELTRFFTRLTGIIRVEPQGDRLQIHSLSGEPQTLIPLGNGLFRDEEAPVATAAFVDDEGGRRGLQGISGGLMASYGAISGVLVWFQWTVAVLALVLMLSSVLFAIVWIPRRLFGGLKGAEHMCVRGLPLLSVLLLVASVAVLISAFGDPILRLGRMTVWSAGYFVLTLLFALATAGAVVEVLRGRSWNLRRGVWMHSVLVSVGCLVVLLYLGYWGLIGLRAWAY